MYAHYNAVFTNVNGSWQARIVELPGCLIEGARSREHAKQVVVAAATDSCQALLNEGYDLPPEHPGPIPADDHERIELTILRAA